MALLKDQDRDIPSIENLYVKEYSSNPSVINVLGFEIPVPMPIKPSKKLFKNYGLPLHEQKFKREKIPKNLKRWDRRSQEQFVFAMYHKRRNGEWWLIGGREIYIPGIAWMFFNFWYTAKGPLPDFRMEAVEFFWVWEFVRDDTNCFGVLDIKPRRIGDTEKTLFTIWEHCSGIRFQNGGMQNVKDDAAQKNFKRLVRGHRKMIWFFKPIHKGSDDPKKTLEFNYPDEHITRKKLTKGKKKGSVAINMDDDPEFDALESKIDFEASVQGRYDGEQLGIYHLDEPGKITAFSVKEQWAVIRRALALHNDRVVVGKSIWTTTVEDYKKGKKGETLSTLMMMKWFWDNSNPSKRDANGRTISGLYRYFRSCVLSDETDEFGFYNEAKTREFVMNSRKALEQISDWDGLAQLARQQPLEIEDVFKIPHDECVLFPILLDKRIEQIRGNLDWRGKALDEEGNEVKPKAIPFDLVWKDNNFGGTVMAIPSLKGRFHISQMPIKPNRKKFLDDKKIAPVADEDYTLGVDPFDSYIDGQKDTDGGITHSMGGGALFRRYDDVVDGNLKRDEAGKIIESEVHKMKTDQFVCDYLYRPQDPYDFYEDMLKLAIFYSVPVFLERDKPGLYNYFRDNGFLHYMKLRPRETKTDHSRSRKVEYGFKASPTTIRMYVNALKVHVKHRIHTYHHLRMLDSHRMFKVHNRTYCDATVAAGVALLANADRMKKEITKEKAQWSQPLWKMRKRRNF